MPRDLQTVADALARTREFLRDLENLHARLDDITLPEYGEMDEQMEYADAIAGAHMECDRKLQSAATELRNMESNLKDLRDVEERQEVENG